MSTLDHWPVAPEGPSVLEAMRRHRWLVVVIVLAATLLAATWGWMRTDPYRATTTVSAPRPAGSSAQTDQQYLDSQVLLLTSRSVRERALHIARQSPYGVDITDADFAASDGAVEVIPPVTDSSGSYGTTIITITFTAESPEAAQVGANALAAAYDAARTQQIQDQGDLRIEGLSAAIAQATDGADAGLRSERAQAQLELRTDLAQGATINAAELPTKPANKGPVTLLGVGLGFGLVLGGAAAYLRAVRLGHVANPDVAGRLYGAPMLWQGRRQPATPRSRRGSSPLTEPDRLLARALMHRVASMDHGTVSVVAVIAAPGHRDRSVTTAGVALALAEAGHAVLAADGADGSVAQELGLDAVAAVSRRVNDPIIVSPLHGGLSVLDLSRGARLSRYEHLLHDWDGVVLVDCPAPQSTSRAVDLLSACDGAVILVRPDEPLREHVEIARWLDLTSTAAIGYAFAPLARRTGSHRRASARRPLDVVARSGSTALPVKAHRAVPAVARPHLPMTSRDAGAWQQG